MFLSRMVGSMPLSISDPFKKLNHYKHFKDLTYELHKKEQFK